ncbi:MAG: arsenate reductase/protein-tyrosine-phosphatase family protein [Promethearchaeota archaeon]
MQKLRNELKDKYWYCYGKLLKNPALPQEINNILFICDGNIMRSIFAERFSKNLVIQTKKNHYNFTSAGLSAKENNYTPEITIKIANQMGVDLGGHQPKKVDRGLISKSDIIVCMDARQFRVLKNKFSDSKKKIFLLPLLSKNNDLNKLNNVVKYNILDPYGKPEEFFEYTFKRIKKCIVNLFEQIDNIA